MVGVRRRASPTELAYRVKRIQELAGTMRAEQVAKEVDVSVSYLRSIAKSNGIKLALKDAGETIVVNIDNELESASRLLRQHGWTVIRPDPFAARAREAQLAAR